jgi:hypothetical protein
MKALFYRLVAALHCSILGDTIKAWYKASQISFQAIPE